MQKLFDLLARLGKALPWIYKLMLHLFTSSASILKKNKEFLTKSSPDSENFAFRSIRSSSTLTPQLYKRKSATQ
jgi:hypothetical protein